jgi:hypothetical protein
VVFANAGDRFAKSACQNQDTMPPLQKAVAALMSFLLVLTTFPVDASPQNTSQPSGPQKEYAPLTPEELDGLVAPIALYPDALVAQVLGAATFPLTK